MKSEINKTLETLEKFNKVLNNSTFINNRMLIIMLLTAVICGLNTLKLKLLIHLIIIFPIIIVQIILLMLITKKFIESHKILKTLKK